MSRFVRVCGAALAASLLLTPLVGAQARAQAGTVALLPVVVHSQGEGSYLQAGIGDMLLSRLSRASGVEVVRLNDPELATTDLESAREIGRAAGASWVLFGSLTSFGDGASLDLRCARTDGDEDAPREVFVHAGAMGEIIPRLDDLSERVARFVSTPGAAAPGGGGGSPQVGAGAAGGAASRAEVAALRARVEALEAALGLGGEAAGGSSGDGDPR